MSPSKPVRTWRRRAEARPNEILEAALAEFVERGFDAARMEDVAKRAGISKAGVYLYFDSKEALLKALIERKLTPLAQQLRAIAGAGHDDPVAALAAMARAGAARLADPAMFAVPRLVISVSARFPDIAQHYRTHVAEIALCGLEKLIEAGIAKGVFRAVEPRAAARSVVGPLLLEALWTHVLQGESALAAPDALVAKQLDVLLKGLSA